MPKWDDVIPTPKEDEDELNFIEPSAFSDNVACIPVEEDIRESTLLLPEVDDCCSSVGDGNNVDDPEPPEEVYLRGLKDGAYKLVGSLGDWFLARRL